MLLNSVSMTPVKGAMGKAGELVAAVEGVLPERWRSRKLYVSMAVVLLVLLTDVDGTRKGLVGLLARVRAGKRPRVMKGATQAQLAEMASGPTKRPKAKPTMKHKPKLKRRT